MACRSRTRESPLRGVVAVSVVGALPLKAAVFVASGINQARTRWLPASLKNISGQERCGRVALGRPSHLRTCRHSRRVGDSVSALETASPQIEIERFAP